MNAKSHVLVVDDEADIRELLAMTLARMGVESHGAATREDAMAAASRRPLMPNLNPMVQYLVWAMEGRGKMSNKEIYKAVERVCKEHGRKLPPNSDAEIRQTLQAHCRTRSQWNGRNDFFVWHERGYWSCNVTSPTINELV